MTWMDIDTWMVLTAAMVAIACVLPGCFLYLSRQSMMSHGIAHAVLPGIVIGHLASGEVETPALFVGAIVAGVACSLLTRFLQRVSGVEEGAALGVSFTFLFAVGLVLQRLLADNVHIEPSHVLMGNLETAIFDYTLSDARAPEAFWRALITVGVNGAVVMLFFKELTYATFDSRHAESVEARPQLMYYLLMTLSALTCVIAFEAVGSILVVAMMIIPPAIASFFTKKLKVLMLLALFNGVFSCVLGHILSISVFGAIAEKVFQLESVGSTNTAGGITVVLCLLLIASMVYQRMSQKLAKKKRPS